jgi:hypothetical protein
MDEARALRRLRKLTDTKGGKITNMHKSGKLAQTIRAAIIDWTAEWDPEKYPQTGLNQEDLGFTMD